MSVTAIFFQQIFFDRKMTFYNEADKQITNRTIKNSQQLHLERMNI